MRVTLSDPRHEVSTAIMSLLRLPDEIVLEITEYMTTVSDRCNVSSSCARLHALIEPLLYSAYVQIRKTAAALFLRTILDKPHLVKHVRTFTVHSINSAYARDDPITDPVQTEIYQRKIQDIVWAEAEPFKADKWVEDLRHDLDCNAYTALILYLLSNVEELTLRLWSHELEEFSAPFTNHLFRVLRRTEATKLDSADWIPSDTTRFQRNTVKRVTLESWDEEAPLVKWCSAFDEYESLESISILGSSDFELSVSGTKKKRYRNLSLLSTDVPSYILEQYLPHFPFLRRFEYSQQAVELQNDGPTASYELSPGVLVRGIQHLKSCLEELVLWCSDYWLNMEAFEPLGSLVEFTQLCSLDVTACMLIGRDLTQPSYHGWDIDHQRYQDDELRDSIGNLPSSLEKLVVRSSIIDILDWLHVLYNGLEDGTSHLKKLRSIKCFQLPTAKIHFDGPDSQIRWHDRAERLGIELVVVPEGKPRWGYPGDLYELDDSW